jgi:hypothetical protein
MSVLYSCVILRTYILFHCQLIAVLAWEAAMQPTCAGWRERIDDVSQHGSLESEVYHDVALRSFHAGWKQKSISTLHREAFQGLVFGDAA